MFKVGLKCGEDGLGIRGVFDRCYVSNCLDVRLVSSSGEETGSDLHVLVVSLYTFSIQGIFLFA